MTFIKMHSLTLFIAYIILFSSCSENSPTNTHQLQSEQTTITLLNNMSQPFNRSQAIENPITIQLLNELNEPVADIFTTFQVIGGDGELILNNERSRIFNIYTDAEGKAEVYWIPDNGIENFLNITITEMDYIAEPTIVCALVQENDEVFLRSLKWLETDEFQFPYIGEPYYIEYNSRVLESNHFLIFSDESPDDIKLGFAALAEDALYKFKTAYEIDYTDLGIFNTNTKIMGYTCKNRYINDPQMFATNNGFLIYGKDSQRWDTWPGYNLEIYRNVLEHELTHLMQFRMGALFHLCESWFVEGIAEYMSGGVHTPITSSSSFNQWRSHPDHTTNPIDAISLNDLSVPLSRAAEYYPTFHLAVKYLLDSDEINRSVFDVKDMFFEIAGGAGFDTAFGNCFGITIEYFRDNYYELMIHFLNN
ncbi:hypothetical protein ACFLTH_08695 [Bacteroidota bacterium]